MRLLKSYGKRMKRWGRGSDRGELTYDARLRKKGTASVETGNILVMDRTKRCIRRLRLEMLTETGRRRVLISTQRLGHVGGCGCSAGDTDGNWLTYEVDCLEMRRVGLGRVDEERMTGEVTV